MSGCFYFPSNVKEILNGKMFVAKKGNKDKKKGKKGYSFHFTSQIFIIETVLISK